jgi:hypothetical protein
MAKYELVEKTEVNGEVWYYIHKGNGFSVTNSWTKKLEEAEKMFKELQEGKSSEPIIKILKTIEVDENKTD